MAVLAAAARTLLLPALLGGASCGLAERCWPQQNMPDVADASGDGDGNA
jgi:hypothetical protein